MATLRRYRGKGQAGRAGADHGQFLRLCGGQVVQQGLVAGTRVDQAADLFVAAEGVVQASLVAGDAGVDLVFAPLLGFAHQFRVGQHRARHRDQVGVAARKHRFGHGGHVDAVAGNNGHVQGGAQAPGDAGEGGARHQRGNRWHRCFMPAEVGADDVDASRFDRLRQLHDLVARHAAFEHVHGRDAKDQDEVGADGSAHAAHHFDSKTHALVKAAAPLVCALIGALHQKGRDQVASRADDLDTVVAGELGHGRTGGEVGDLFFDAGGVEFARLERGDARFDGGGRNTVRVRGDRAHVQDLHADLDIGVGCVHGVGHAPVLRGFGAGRELGAVAAFGVGRDAAGDDHANAAARALGEVGRQALETVLGFFEPGVHGAHQHAVFQAREAQLQRCEEQGVMGVGVHENLNQQVCVNSSRPISMRRTSLVPAPIS